MELDVGNESKGKGKESVSHVDDQDNADSLKIIVGYHIRFSATSNHLNDEIEGLQVLESGSVFFEFELLEPGVQVQGWLDLAVDVDPEARSPMPEKEEDQDGFDDVHEDAQVFHVYLKSFKE